MKNNFLPLNSQDMKDRGWDYVDIVLVTGDAYVDHPSFAMAIIGRVLEAQGYRVAILAQPKWNSCEDFKMFGQPKLFFGIASGNMDSMINKYTHNRKIRSEDDYSPGGKSGLRPDRATIVYSQRAKESYKNTPIILGGIEAGMRRFAHYDYWSDKVRKSILLDCKADMLVYGMGEKTITAIAKLLSDGIPIKDIRDVRQTMYPLGKSETENIKTMPGVVSVSDAPQTTKIENSVLLPSFEETSSDKIKFSEATRIIYEESNPYNAKTLIQCSGSQAIVQNPPDFPISGEEMDAIYDLPYKRLPHPSYEEKIPAFEMIKNSVVSHRGCFGGCSFCSLTLHQGRIIQSRSEKSIEKEITLISALNNKETVISDIGGPTANMYKINAKDFKICEKCKKLSCVYPSVCENLNINFKPLLKLLKRARRLPRIKKVFVASGIRMDLALLSENYISEIAKFHTSGHLKTAPEHISEKTLNVMKKPSKEVFMNFAKKFKEASLACGKEQYILPYFISSHPGCTLEDMAELALFLKENSYRPRQVNDFLPAPMELSTSIYYTGLDPFTLEEVFTAKGDNERRLQRALLQYFRPENNKLVFIALKKIKKLGMLRRLK
jgi:uncharacterized radical SAM protein YgiQ